MQQNNNDFKAEKYYQQIVNLANVAILKFDRQFILTDFTGNSEKIFGFKKEEVIGRSLYETIVPHQESSGRNLVKLINAVIDHIDSYEYNENENIRKDGTRIWMQWYNSEIRNQKNELTGILSIGIDITDRINMEAALKESEERFKTLSDLTFEGILIHDNGLIIDCNLSFERQIGYARNELIGMQLFDRLIPHGYREQMMHKISMDSVQYEAETIHKDGTIIPISIESKSTKIGEKQVRVAAIRNISELKRTIHELDQYKHHLEEIVRQRTHELKTKSKELQQQNDLLQMERNQLRTIIDHIPDLIYIKDTKSRFLNANLMQIIHLRQKELSEITGKTDRDFFNENYAGKYYTDEQHIMSTGNPMINTEELGINEKDEQIYLSSTKIPLKDKNGKIVGLVGIGRDITEKRIAENKLTIQKKYLEEYNLLLEERTQKIEKLNADLFDSNDKLESANRILSERKKELEQALEQLKTAQSQLIQSEKMASLGILLAGIAHEINNPVNFIYAGVNSMIKDFEDISMVIESCNAIQDQSSDVHTLLTRFDALKKEHEFETAYIAITETLQDVKLGATRIREIVNGLSRFSRMEQEQWKSTDIHDEIDSVLVLLKNKYKHHIEVVKEYDSSLPLVECHAGKLNQVFMNIINNAIDAINQSQGRITIKTGKYDDHVFISITDTGCGIKEEEKKKIFDPFFTTKEVGYGLGLGLAISYSIIQEHDGEITVKSAVGKGSEFIIKIPVVQFKGK